MTDRPISRRRVLTATAASGAAVLSGGALLAGARPASAAPTSLERHDVTSTFVLVPGAWAGGFVWHAVARELEKRGYGVFAPTLPGMSPGDDPGNFSLDDATRFLVSEINRRDLQNVILVAHDWSGYPVTAAAHQVLRRVSSIVYWSAVVPLARESMLDTIPADDRAALSGAAAAAGGHSVLVPVPRWENRFVQTATQEVKDLTYGLLRPEPWAYFTDSLSTREAAIPDVPVSYLVSSQDLSLPAGDEWWADKYAPRLGVEPIVFEAPHAAYFTDPLLLTDQLIAAGKA
ncbi:MAG: alpha/beta fold hydrolase [Catenulispora sp.]|nr:alpha/beta fold hydrolase [Catenulispora sp.]